VLVATDVAARGLDIAKLEAVINVDVTPDPEVTSTASAAPAGATQDGWALSLASATRCGGWTTSRGSWARGRMAPLDE
jgi:ATP-independent RNA helicase DbpA